MILYDMYTMSGLHVAVKAWENVKGKLDQALQSLFKTK